LHHFIASALIWIAASMGMDGRLEAPNLVYLTQDELNSNSQHISLLGEEYFVHGQYRPAEDTVYLRDDFDLRNPYHRSVLVHELIHYVQDIRNIYYECDAMYEEEAYRLQAEWNAQNGLEVQPIPYFVLADIRACEEEAFAGSILGTDEAPVAEEPVRVQTQTVAPSGVRIIRGN
jgi:hypothetical protein